MSAVCAILVASPKPWTSNHLASAFRKPCPPPVGMTFAQSATAGISGLPKRHIPTTETQHRVHGSLEGITARARWELPLSFHTEAFESSETEKENYCLLRAEILLSISDPGVRYLFRSSLTSPLLVRGPHYTHVYLLHAVYCQTLLASQLDFVT